MNKHSVIIDYSREPDKELDNLAQSAYNSLNPNTNFTWAATVMPAFLTGITSYRTKLETAQVGTTKDVLAKNVAKQALADQMRTIALEINRQAAGDLVKLTSSGFTLAKEPSPKGVLPKPTGFKVERGTNSGDIRFVVDANTDAARYNFYSALTPASTNMDEWRLISSSTRKKNVSGYIPGKQYAFVCAYQGTEDTLVYSEPILLYVS